MIDGLWRQNIGYCTAVHESGVSSDIEGKLDRDGVGVELADDCSCLG